MVDLRFNASNGSGEVVLAKLNQISIILGRNGSGKSRFLRELDKLMREKNEYNVRYVTPERAGSFQRDGNVETNVVSNPNWESEVRRKNQTSNFKQMSHLHLREAEIAYLRGLQGTDARERSFQAECLDPISRLLSNVSILQFGGDFQFLSANGEQVGPEQLSSGESEAIAVAAEILSFFRSIDYKRLNVLLLDEPDVHQHPDLQARFGHYLLNQIESLVDEARRNVLVIIATHSTSLVCALGASERTSIGNKDFDSRTVKFAPLAERVRDFAPFFGHPLSLSLSQDPMLILEGEDDERVWQQAARSSNGRIKLFPVLARSKDQQTQLERLCGPMLEAVYDHPVAYSLRDGDGKVEQLDPVGPVTRFRLQCYEIENTLVTTECLSRLGLSWEGFQARAGEWLAAHADRDEAVLLQELVTSADRLRHKKIKALRNIILGIAKCEKQWEVVVGQALASVIGGTVTPQDPYALLGFIGEQPARALLHSK